MMPILQPKVDWSAIRRFLRAISGAALRRISASADKPFPQRDPPGDRGNTTRGPCPATTIRQRLAKGLVSLEHLDAERERLGDSHFGMAAEDRIVWSELIELELQEIDEQVSRICGTAGAHSRTSPGIQPKPGRST